MRPEQTGASVGVDLREKERQTDRQTDKMTDKMTEKVRNQADNDNKQGVIFFKDNLIRRPV